MSRLHAFTAADLARINRVVRTVESAPWKRGASQPVAAPAASDIKLGFNSYASVSPGGSGLFDWRQSTAAGSTEITMGASTILAYDWFGNGLSTGEKVLLFQPRPSARWYFMKPGQGSGGTIQWAKVLTTATTRVASGFGSTASLWYAVQPCANSQGDTPDTATTYVVCVPKGSTSLHFATTGDIVAIAKDSTGLYSALGHTGIRGWMCREGTATLGTGASTYFPFQFSYQDIGHTNAADFISASAGCTEITLLRRGLYMMMASISLYGNASQDAPGAYYNFFTARKGAGVFTLLPGARVYGWVENDANAITGLTVQGLYSTTATTDIVGVGANANLASVSHTAACHAFTILHLSSRGF